MDRFQIYWSAQVFQIMRRDDAEPVFARMLTYVNSGMCSADWPSRSARIRLAPRGGSRFSGCGGLVPVIVAAYCVKGIGDFLRCLFLAEGRPGYDAVCNWLGAVGCLGIPAPDPKFGGLGEPRTPPRRVHLPSYRLRGMDVPSEAYRVETGRLAKICVASAAAAALVPCSTLLPCLD